MTTRRPLPTPPGPSRGYLYNQYTLSRPPDLYSPANPFYHPHVYPEPFDEPTNTVPAGTLLHKGFYDLLAMIPTPNPSRLFWSQPQAESAPAPPTAPEAVVAGPRYEDLPTGRPLPVHNTPYTSPSSPSSAKRGRRISKDMVSRPTGFMCVFEPYPIQDWSCTDRRAIHAVFSHLVHASDVAQAEALLTRWGPDGIGKLGGKYA
jgi:protein-serine/threonine kinase